MQTCPVGEGREGGKGLRWGVRALYLSKLHATVPDSVENKDAILNCKENTMGTGVRVEFSLC